MSVVVLSAMFFQQRQILWLALLALAIAVVLVVWTYRRMPEMGGWGKVAGVLKVIGVALLLLCLLEPLLEEEKPKQGANYFAVLADSSESLQVKSHDAEEARGLELRSVLTGDESMEGWMKDLGDQFRVHNYTFGERLRRVEGYEQLVFDEKTSAMVTALEDLGQRYEGRPLAGAVVFTDGNFPSQDLAGRKLDVPIFAVEVGAGPVARDCAIRSVVLTETIFEDAPITISAELSMSQFEGTPVEVSVLDQDGKVLETQTVATDLAEYSEALHFRVKPEEPGLVFYQVRCQPKPGAGAEPIEEATLKNNAQFVAANRDGEPRRILYVAGRPNWEYKFLNRSLAEDPVIEMVGLIRVAKKEPKFTWKGRDGESTNPLFRGFAGKGEEENYDQAVIKRVNVKDEEELKGNFPSEAEELFRYDAIILDDVESAFFTAAQQQLIEQFVSQRGGGFLMLGGMESMGTAKGAYEKTPIAQVLPVYLDRKRQPDAQAVDLEFSKEGLLEPWMRLRDSEEGERERLMELPKFANGLNPIGAPKPGASVLAYFSTAGKKFPAVISQNFGKGRSMAIPIASVWSWGFKSKAHMDDMGKFWRQVSRKLVADAPRRTSVEVEIDANRFPAVAKVRISVFDKEFDPDSGAKVMVSVAEPGGGTSEREATLSLEEAGVYETEMVSVGSGNYVATATATDADGKEVGSVQAGWSVNTGLQEFQNLNGNRAMLEQLVAKTGGEMVAIDDLDGFVAGLQDREVPITEKQWTPFWHEWWLFVTALGCFLGEWGIKRWKGVP